MLQRGRLIHLLITVVICLCRGILLCLHRELIHLKVDLVPPILQHQTPLALYRTNDEPYAIVFVVGWIILRVGRRLEAYPVLIQQVHDILMQLDIDITEGAMGELLILLAAHFCHLLVLGF